LSLASVRFVAGCCRPARLSSGFVTPGGVVRAAFPAWVAGSCGSMSTPAWQSAALWHEEFSMSAHYDRGPGRTGERQGCQATRRSVIAGRCLRPPSNVTARSSRSPGLPLTSVCGVAHGDARPPGRRGGLGPTGVVAALRPGPRTRSSKSAATPGTRIWPPSSRTIWPTSTAPSAPRWPDDEINRRLSARTFIWPDSDCRLFRWQCRAQQ